MEINLKKFNMQNIKFDPNEATGPVILMLGKRGVGKSFLIKDLLYHHQTVPTGMVISATEDSNSFFGKIVPRMFIHTEYNTQLISNILCRQRDVLNTIKKRKELYGHDNTDPRTFLIMDDCIYDNSWTKDKLIRYLFLNGRHAKVLFIMTSQFPLGIPPLLRTNIDYVFILRESIVSNRKRLYENYAGMCQTFDIFCKIMDGCTENFGCLVIDNTTTSNKLTDQLYWYKAEERPNYRMGADEIWELSKNMENESSNSMFDENPVPKKGTKINIKKSGW